MCDEYEVLEFLETDRRNTRRARIQRKLARDQNDPFSLEEAEFIKRYRLTKDLVYMLCDELRPHVTQRNRAHDLSLETKVLIALSFYATGSYQRDIGEIAGHSVAQVTVSLAISQVTTCLNSPHFRNKYIKFPNNLIQCKENITRFYNKFGMPGVLGCIDCTHVAIMRPKHNEERYCPRKQSYSLNVQLICNCDLEIMSVDASHGGASHDADIWSKHPLKTYMEELSSSEAVWLLGDTVYPLRKTMMTPVIDAAPDSPEAHYNEVHDRAYNTIERTIGILKARFRCLLVHRVLHYDPLMAASIINACVILHNICNNANLPIQDLTHVEALKESQLQGQFAHLKKNEVPVADSSQITQDIELQDGMAVRKKLISEMCEKIST